MRRFIPLAAAALAACALAAPAGADTVAAGDIMPPLPGQAPTIEPIPLPSVHIKRGQTIVLSIPYTCKSYLCDVRIRPMDGPGRQGASGARGDYNPSLAVRRLLHLGWSIRLKLRVQALRSQSNDGKWFWLVAVQQVEGALHERYSYINGSHVFIHGTYYVTTEANPYGIQDHGRCPACGPSSMPPSSKSTTPVVPPSQAASPGDAAPAAPPPASAPSASPPLPPADVPTDTTPDGTVPPPSTAPNPVLISPPVCIACVVQQDGVN
jgi:hypothetical protein